MRVTIEINCDNAAFEGEIDEETGEFIEPDYSDIYEVASSDIVESLFGKTIVREFR